MTKTTSKVKNQITELLNIEYPVIQAAMVWLTSAEFVAAVSSAGGLGVLASNAGQTEQATGPKDAAEKMRQQIQKVRQITDKPFAVNYILPTFDKERSYDYSYSLLDVILAEKVEIVVLISHGDSSDSSSIKRLQQAGIKILFRDISPTLESALAAEKLGVDALIITGHEAGGHLSEHQISTQILLSQILKAINLPVIAAGGIYDAKTAHAAFAMGAQAVYIGTRFINTIESPASMVCKEAIIGTSFDDLVIINSPVGQLRVIGKYNLDRQILASPQEYIGSFRHMLLGNKEPGYICVSQSAGAINDIISCKALITEIMSEV
ncbi:nitronate monooxygenase [Orbus wheelerorum]|uniref:NAD(P)H-dependent flavin oxidoreductase n=1 Tax=Orbus wheelerorum TaxID=3074111 RepID=UPI00370D1118